MVDGVDNMEGFDKCIAAIILEKCETLKITHDKVANHLGTTGEVITRMVHYFQSEQLAHLLREN